MGTERQVLLKYLLFSVAVLVMPVVFAGGYLLNVLVFVGINTMLALALNLLLGYAGQISLGQAAFFGLGAYISGVATATYGMNPWTALVLAACIVGLIAFAIGFPILKLKGHYLAMATLGFGIIIYIFFNETIDLTGGPSGLSGIPYFSVGEFQFDSDTKNYYLIWGFALLMILFSVNLVNSRIGRALRAINDSEVAAGSSSRMISGSRARARAISRRRHLPKGRFSAVSEAWSAMPANSRHSRALVRIRRSSRLTPGSFRAEERMPLRLLVWRPIMTFSRTVIRPNNSTF